MKNTTIILVAMTFSLMSPLHAAAQEDRVTAMEQQVAERDKVISELLERVEALESRLGVAPPRQLAKAADPRPQMAEAIPASSAPTPTTAPRPGAVIVDEFAAERALERSLTREGAVLLPKGWLEIEPSLAYQRHEMSNATLVSLGMNVAAGDTDVSANYLTADVALRLGLPFQSQLELGLPYQYADTQTVTYVGGVPQSQTNRSGQALGDIRIGLAKTLMHEAPGRPDLVARVTWDTDSGDRQASNVPLGSGYNEIRAGLTATKRQDPVAFVGGLSYQTTLEKDNFKPGDAYGVDLGGALALSPQTSVRVFFNGRYVEDVEVNGTAIEGTSQVIGNFIIGGSTLVGRGKLVNYSLGIGVTDDSDDFSFRISTPIRRWTPLF